MKAILFIADGMADRPVKELGGKTPLEAAHKPSLNEVARSGVCGIIDPIAPGVPPGSDTATLSLLGYDAIKVYSGRGAFEVLGSGMEVLPGDVCFRCNFATVNEDFVVLDRRAGRISNEDASKLAETIQREVVVNPALNVNFLFKNTIQHRAVLVLRGAKLSTAISDADPGHVGEKVLTVKPLDKTQEAKRTAEIVNVLTNEFYKVLKDHEVNVERVKRGLPAANIVLCRGAGSIPKIQPLTEKYGVKAACISAAPLIKGVCKVAGLDLIDVEGATGTPQTNYLGKAKAAVQALTHYDFVFLHVKATDAASHDKNFKQKIEIIEKIDGMFEYLLKNINTDSTYLAVTADHTTPVMTGNHEADPVPVAITGPGVRSDDVAEFSERACAKGGLNRIRGMDLMPILMNFLGKTKKFGA
ncbi:MAG: 2,3-bisphosphoglycerate-independent phosphoglycerate mutase [Candidatus Bathyarchaeia archaeon]